MCLSLDKNSENVLTSRPTCLTAQARSDGDVVWAEEILNGSNQMKPTEWWSVGARVLLCVVMFFAPVRDVYCIKQGKW